MGPRVVCPLDRLTLLVLAGHALVQAVDGAPGDPQAKSLLTECLTRLATSPIGDRVQPGDLAFALTDEQRQSADTTVFARDEIRRFLTEASLSVARGCTGPGQRVGPVQVARLPRRLRPGQSRRALYGWRTPHLPTDISKRICSGIQSAGR